MRTLFSTSHTQYLFLGWWPTRTPFTEPIQTCLLVSKPIGCLPWKISLLLYQDFWCGGTEYAQGYPQLQWSRSQAARGQGRQVVERFFLTFKQNSEKGSYTDFLSYRASSSLMNWNLGILCLGFFEFHTCLVHWLKPTLVDRLFPPTFQMNIYHTRWEGC